MAGVFKITGSRFYNITNAASAVSGVLYGPGTVELGIYDIAADGDPETSINAIAKAIADEIINGIPSNSGSSLAGGITGGDVGSGGLDPFNPLDGNPWRGAGSGFTNHP